MSKQGSLDRDPEPITVIPFEECVEHLILVAKKLHGIGLSEEVKASIVRGYAEIYIAACKGDLLDQ